MALRSVAVWQTELAMVGWSVVCAALASYVAEAEPNRFDNLLFGVNPLTAVGFLFAFGLMLCLALRKFLLRWDFRFVTDEATYFFFDNGEKAFFCSRKSIRAVRHEAEGIALEMEHETIHVSGDRPLILIAVSNLLEQWAGDGQASNLCQSPPAKPGGR